jgi:uncharacterized protein DUF899
MFNINMYVDHAREIFMATNKVVSPAEWLEARKALLAKEKEFNRLRDDLSRQRRELPWERVEKNYVFEGPDGKETLAAPGGISSWSITSCSDRGGRPAARAARSGPTISTTSSRILPPET